MAIASDTASGMSPTYPAAKSGMMRDMTGQLLEVACDESGSEGEKLIGGETDVFAHASVRLDTEAAAACIQEIRERIRSPAVEYKSNHLLRKRHRSVLEWLLGASGPIHGNAHVHLTDKEFFVTGKIIDILGGEAAYAAIADRDRQATAMAVTLYRDGRRTFEREQWESFLGSFNDLLRVKNRRGSEPSVDSFFRVVDTLHLAGAPGPVVEIMSRLRRARPQVDVVRSKLLDNSKMISALDPLIPAIVRAVAHWGGDGRPVYLVHDEQLSLTDERISQLGERVSSLAGLQLVDSRSDSRVQVADFLAGVARKIASDELNQRGDAELTALLRPYVDSFSIWADDRSWALLKPTD